jgi:hypothetical protein
LKNSQNTVRDVAPDWGSHSLLGGACKVK